MAILVFPAVAAQPQTQPDGGIEFVAQSEPQKLFGGQGRPVSVRWRNAGEHTAQTAISTRVYQASSTTAIPLRQNEWKALEILAGQTILETAALDFPAVRAETRFLVQWLQSTNIVLGITEVWVYPTNLLQELKALADGAPVGVFDPQNRLKPLLQALNVELADLQTITSKRFSGHLAIFGPFDSKRELPEDLPDTIEELAKRGAGIVWILPRDQEADLRPSFYLAPIGRGVVAVVTPELVADLAQRPQAQVNLVELCRLALHPKQFTLPLLASEP